MALWWGARRSTGAGQLTPSLVTCCHSQVRLQCNNCAYPTTACFTVPWGFTSLSARIALISGLVNVIRGCGIPAAKSTDTKIPAARILLSCGGCAVLDQPTSGFRLPH